MDNEEERGQSLRRISVHPQKRERERKELPRSEVQNLENYKCGNLENFSPGEATLKDF